MIRGENIVCFSKDWNEDPTSNNHVLSLLAEDNRVLWINSIAMRTPSVTAGRDLIRMGRKLLSFFKGAVEVRPNLWVWTPVVIPLPHSRVAQKINRQIIRLFLSILRKRLGMKQFQLWTFVPNAVDVIGEWGQSHIVYYCIDDWGSFDYIDGPKMLAKEERLCRKADVVIATSQTLFESKREFNSNTHLVTHGVNHEHFSQALDDATQTPSELLALSGPIIGFFGLLDHWIDQKLIRFVAERHPEWSIVLIGKSNVDLDGLAGTPNVHVIGRRPYEQLPRYCKGFSAAIIPFEVNELTRHVNPIKLREYLSAGLPVVSTSMPEVRRLEPLCRVAETYDEFVQALETALAEDSAEARRRRSRAMEGETWRAKVDLLGTIVQAAGRDKSQLAKSTHA